MERKEYIQAVKELAEIMKENDLQYVCVQVGEAQINLASKPQPQFVQAQPVQSAPPVRETEQTSANKNTVKAPIVGTYYESPSPDKPPFVKVGDKVKKGQVICIIESMKLMNEVACNFDGTVREIYAVSGEAVEFDQDLMLIE